MTNPRLRNPSAKKDWKKFETPRHKNHPNTGLGDPSKTFPKFRDWAKIEAHETESPTPNCTVTFQLCQTGSDSEGLPHPPRVVVDRHSHEEPWGVSTSDPSACMENRVDFRSVLCFCVSRLVSCDRNCDWQRQKMQMQAGFLISKFACYWKAQLIIALNMK